MVGGAVVWGNGSKIVPSPSLQQPTMLSLRRIKKAAAGAARRRLEEGEWCETMLYPHSHPTPQTRLPFPSFPNTLARNLLVRLFLAELRPSLEIFAALHSASPSQTCMCTRSWILAALIPQLRQKTKGLPSCCEAA